MEDFIPGWTPENTLVAVVLLGGLALFIKQGYHTSTGWRLGLFLWTAFLLFYMVGAITLAQVTNYRALPDETGPWLLLIFVAAGYWWVKKGKGMVGPPKIGSGFRICQSGNASADSRSGCSGYSLPHSTCASGESFNFHIVSAQ